MRTAPAADPTLQAEHDALAARLEIRRSVDAMRRGLYLAFATVIAAGTSAALAWDRYGPVRPGVVRPEVTGWPMFLYLALAVLVVLALAAGRAFLVARRLGREEDALFGRYRDLRAALGLDA